MAWGEGSGFTGGYEEALKKAAEQQARQWKLDAQRKAKDNPVYKIGQILEPIGQVTDIGLAAAGLPPIAGMSASALKGLAGAASGVEGESAVGALKDAAGIASTYMAWDKARSAKKKKQDFIQQMQQLIKAGEGASPPKTSPKPVKTGEMSLDETITDYAKLFA
jgi:hypothetical protein